MSRYNDMSDDDRRREERRQYENDVFYDVWRSGRNPDAIDYDRVSDHYWDGLSAEDSARHEIRAQQRAQERLREEYEPEDEPTP